jgi:RNA polymerase sigma-70 factor, ECF subfamily
VGPSAAEPLSDAELLSAAASGEPDAFGELVRRHRDRLWAVALRTLGNPDEAADALQDALVSALRAAGSYRGEAAVTTWLHRIVVNACLDRARRQATRPTVGLPVDDRGLPPGPDQVAARELELDVTAALATLPLEQRAVLVLVDMQGHSVDEAARILDIAPGTVKSRGARGRARLLPLLQHLRAGNSTASRTGNPDATTDVPSGARSDMTTEGGVA